MIGEDNEQPIYLRDRLWLVGRCPVRSLCWHYDQFCFVHLSLLTEVFCLGEGWKSKNTQVWSLYMGGVENGIKFSPEKNFQGFPIPSSNMFVTMSLLIDLQTRCLWLVFCYFKVVGGLFSTSICQHLVLCDWLVIQFGSCLGVIIGEVCLHLLVSGRGFGETVVQLNSLSPVSTSCSQYFTYNNHILFNFIWLDTIGWKMLI